MMVTALPWRLEIVPDEHLSNVKISFSLIKLKGQSLFLFIVSGCLSEHWTCVFVLLGGRWILAGCKISPPKGKSEQDSVNKAWSHTHTHTQRLSWRHSTGYDNRPLGGPSKWIIFATEHTYRQQSVRKAGDLSFSRERLLRLSESVTCTHSEHTTNTTTQHRA